MLLPANTFRAVLDHSSTPEARVRGMKFCRRPIRFRAPDGTTTETRPHTPKTLSARAVQRLLRTPKSRTVVGWLRHPRIGPADTRWVWRGGVQRAASRAGRGAAAQTGCRVLSGFRRHGFTPVGTRPMGRRPRRRRSRSSISSRDHRDIGRRPAPVAGRHIGAMHTGRRARDPERPGRTSEVDYHANTRAALRSPARSWTTSGRRYSSGLTVDVPAPASG